MNRRFNPRHQTGAALVTAMLLAALIVTLSAAWLARFDTQLKVVQTQRTGTQVRWLQRAAIDWARMILQEDAAQVDHLAEVWAVPIEAVRITDIAGAQEAFFSGQLKDAQGLFNVHNLRGEPTPLLVAWATQLAQQNGLTAVQAKAWVEQLKSPPADTEMLVDILPSSFTQAQKDSLTAVFIWLPVPTLLNINTAPVAVLSAHPALGAQGAAAAMRYRENVYFKDTANIAQVLNINTATVSATLSVSTAHFLATGRVTVERMDAMGNSLLQRNGSQVKLLWTVSL